MGYSTPCDRAIDEAHGHLAEAMAALGEAMKDQDGLREYTAEAQSNFYAAIAKVAEAKKTLPRGG